MDSLQEMLIPNSARAHFKRPAATIPRLYTLHPEEPSMKQLVQTVASQ